MPATKKKKATRGNPCVLVGADLYENSHTIRLKPKDAVNGFFILATNGQTTRLPNNTYVVGKEHLDLLDKAGIHYKVTED